MGKKRYIGVGLYTYSEAARIIGVKPSTLRGWVKEYYYTARGARYHHEPVIVRYFSPQEPILTFRELVEPLFVQLFRAEGVSMRAIRRASQRAARMFDTDYPFAVKRFDTDGRRIFATLEHEAHGLMEDLSQGQFVFEAIVRPFFRKREYCGDADAVKFWPLERQGRVVLDPERSFGKPIDAETGVLTAVLFDAVMAGQGQSVKEVADWYEVSIAAVEAAVAYERSLHAA